jgi:hypothetical protein
MEDRVSAENWAVVPELLDLFPLLKDFHQRFASQLPLGAAQALECFFEQESKRFERDDRPPHLGGGVLLAALLSKVKAQVDYFLSDKHVRTRRAIERAFTHLQRSIVVDEDLQQKWEAAFNEMGEEACERLGAVHLLWHGIWAFKANAVGGRTDLIMGGDVHEQDAVRAADAMVLTEWKLVRKGDAPQEKAMEAFHQAARYTRETLAGFELSSHRYLVLVSEDLLTEIPSVPSLAGRLYEVRNIAVKPSTPSVTARAAIKALNSRT